ncbi:hypothetical protein TWF718_004555 [Orbilia javanica]|uniref:Uncharacterized protein n=1 Tax=Orbilia javanica TaxID=47235 RepID=A0AAN8N8H7_9PEZI
MSFNIGVPTGGEREQDVPTTFDFGPGFSTIDINTVVKSIATSSSDEIASKTTLSQTTTLATLTRSRGFGNIDASSTSLAPATSEPAESTSSTRLTPTTRPPAVTEQPSLPSFPTIIIATDIQTGSATVTEMTAPTASNGSNVTTSQPTEASSQPAISTGAAVGIALIVTVVLALLGFGIFRYLKQKKSQGLPPSSKKAKGQPAQMAPMPYMANERSLEEGWESGSTIAPFTFDEPDRTGLGLTGFGEHRNSNASLERLPIRR